MGAIIWLKITNVNNNWLKIVASSSYLLWPRKGSLMKTQTRILDNRLYYTRKIKLHRKGKKSRTVRITPIVICPSSSEISVLITVRRVHYSKMGKVPTIPLPQAFYFVKVLLIFLGVGSIVNGSVNFLFRPDRRISGVGWRGTKLNMSKMVSIGSSSVCGTSLESFKRHFCNWFWCLLCVYLGLSTMYTISPILF